MGNYLVQGSGGWHLSMRRLIKQALTARSRGQLIAVAQEMSELDGIKQLTTDSTIVSFEGVLYDLAKRGRTSNRELK